MITYIGKSTMTFVNDSRDHFFRNSHAQTWHDSKNVFKHRRYSRNLYNSTYTFTTVRCAMKREFRII